MLNFVDTLLNGVTMYRLVLYYLVALVIIAAVFGAFGVMSYSWLSIGYSVLLVLVVCLVMNKILARIFKVPANVESVYITALILALIITPVRPGAGAGSWFLVWAAVWAMASKYLLSIRQKHLFNPAAFAVALTAVTINQSASWWVGTAAMLPFVLVGGLLVVRKLQRFDLVWGFLGAALVTIVGTALARGSLSTTLKTAVVDSPLLFFAFIMLTEPLTTPPTRTGRVAYGLLTGFLFAPNIHLGGIYSTPELALLAANLFSYVISPKGRYRLQLREKKPVGRDIYDFVFRADRPVAFRPGQYLEWTVGHPGPDNRGNRRYFTIASSPTEREIRLGVKFYPASSSFKKALLAMRPGTAVIASQLAGEFVLPKDPLQKLIFLAGGIGITPFRSMLKYLLDHREKRPIIVFYSNRTPAEIVYAEVLEQARRQLGIKVVYTLTDRAAAPRDWPYQRGRIDETMIAQEAPDYRARHFYISGTHAMAVAFQEVLKNMGIHRHQIKTDFFPGF